MKNKVFKKLALLLSTLMIFTFLFTACGDTEDTVDPNEETEQEQSIDEGNTEDEVEDEDAEEQDEDEVKDEDAEGQTEDEVEDEDAEEQVEDVE